MEYSSKLDLLREMARACEGEASKAYLVGLLAERAEEEECTAEVLAWVGEALAGR